MTFLSPCIFKSREKEYSMAEDKKIKTPFDKFIDDQIQRQNKKVKDHQRVMNNKETPQEKYNKLYIEKPNNRIVWNKK